MNQFLSLHLNNFFSHRDTSLDFSEHEGLILIEGINQDGRYESNGSGKSTLLEGIIYALTGNTASAGSMCLFCNMYKISRLQNLNASDIYILLKGY